MSQRYAHRTAAETGLLGDGNGNIRIPGTDLVLFRLATSTGRVQAGHLARVRTGEVVFSGGAYTVAAADLAATVLADDAIIIVERLSGRAPCGWRIVPDGIL